jgi:HPt (histidine-containing phosphotransfer) domain-containing protein
MNARLKDIIESFCASLPEQIEVLARHAVGAADFEALRQAAHRLKGTARSLGLDELERPLSAIESKARAALDPTSLSLWSSDGFGGEMEALRELSNALQPSDSKLWGIAMR